MRAEDMTDAELALAPHRIPGPVAAALLAAGAITPAQAARYAPADDAARADLARHLAAGTVRRVGNDGALWLDLRRWYATDRRRSRRRALVAAVLALVVAIVATLFYRL